jgi:hypothetical protein
MLAALLEDVTWVVIAAFWPVATWDGLTVVVPTVKPSGSRKRSWTPRCHAGSNFG